MGPLLRAMLQRSGLALTRPARRSFRYLAQYYPPIYYAGYIEKLVGFQVILRTADETGIDGDVAECGVGRGLSLFMLAHFMARASTDRMLFGFDSFQGFPQPTAADASPRRPVRGDLWTDTSLEHVRNHFLHGGLAAFFDARVRLVPGFFSESLPQTTEPSRIAFLNLDVDLYESYRDCLRHLGPRVTGIILYDEYQSPKWPGATLAVDEALPHLSHSMFYSPTMDRYASLPTGAIGEPFAAKVIDRLGLRPAQ